MSLHLINNVKEPPTNVGGQSPSLDTLEGMTVRPFLATRAVKCLKNQRHRLGGPAYMGGVPSGQRDSVFFLKCFDKPWNNNAYCLRCSHWLAGAGTFRNDSVVAVLLAMPGSIHTLCLPQKGTSARRQSPHLDEPCPLLHPASAWP